jgi:hypothetical protein
MAAHLSPCQHVKKLLAGYLYSIKPERCLAKKIQLNIADRWFWGFEHKLPYPPYEECVIYQSGRQGGSTPGLLLFFLWISTSCCLLSE